MKNTLKVDFSKRQIIMDRTFAKNCMDTSSDEYAKLQSVRSDYPKFRVITRTIKRKKNKATYKGLTYKYMENHISKISDKEEAEKALSEYNKLREIAKCHKGKGYPVIKKWFLKSFPEVKEFLAAA